MNEKNKILNVFYDLKKVGELIEDSEERLSFSYSKEWLESNEAFSLSLALKLNDKIFSHLETKSFFENLLPEGEVKTILEKTSKRNISDEFNFLREYGVDCAGAFIISKSEKLKKTQKFKNKEITLKSLYKYLDNRQSLTSAMINKEGGRFSLAGAQDKFPVIYKKKKIYLPLNGEPTTHILKPYVLYHKDTADSPYNEYFCMNLAKSVGLNVPKVILIEGKYPLYLVERFDREVIKNKTVRVHQHDFCQAHGITSKKKYEADGGPTLSDNYQLIKTVSSLPVKDLSAYLNWMWFNLLIGNNDCHSKNLSFIYSKEGLRLAPFYDLLSTVIYKDLTKKFSYQIGGQWMWHNLKNKHFNLLAKSFDIDVSLILNKGRDLIKKIEKKLKKEVSSFDSKFEDVETAKKIEEVIEKRIGQLRKVY